MQVMINRIETISSAHGPDARRVRIEAEAIGFNTADIMELEKINRAGGLANLTMANTGTSSFMNTSMAINSGATASEVLQLQSDLITLRTQAASASAQTTVLKGEISTLQAVNINRESKVIQLERQVDDMRKQVAALEMSVKVLTAPPQLLGDGLPTLLEVVEPGAFA